MEWREALDEAQTQAEIETLSHQILATRRAVLQKCESLLDVVHDYPAAVEQVRALMFIERFARDLEDRMDRLIQEN
jgi:molecular chaperone HscB